MQLSYFGILGGVGTTEILVILVVALLVLGPNQLPKVARTLGKTLRDLRRAADGIQDEIRREISDGGPDAAAPPPAAPADPAGPPPPPPLFGPYPEPRGPSGPAAAAAEPAAPDEPAGEAGASAPTAHSPAAPAVADANAPPPAKRPESDAS